MEENTGIIAGDGVSVRWDGGFGAAMQDILHALMLSCMVFLGS